MRAAGIPFTDTMKPQTAIFAGGFFSGQKKNIQFDDTIARHEDDTIGVDVEVAETTNGYQHGTNPLHRPRLARRYKMPVPLFHRDYRRRPDEYQRKVVDFV